MKKSIYYLAAILVLASCSKDEDTSPSDPTPPGDPVALRLDSITVTGFNEMNDAGSYWDGGSGSNLPDIYIEVDKNNIRLFTSTVWSSADPSGSHLLISAQSGSLPISFNETDDLKIRLYDNDGDPAVNAPDYIGIVSITNILPFLYGGDHAAGISNVEVSGDHGITMKLSGAFIY